MIERVATFIGVFGPVAVRVVLCALIAGAASFRAGLAEATSVSFSLAWNAPPECPDSDYLRAQVETLLAGAPPTLAWVTARAEVSRRDDGTWTVQLTTNRDGTVGERSLEADACGSLADATALVVALTIDPAHVGGTEEIHDGTSVALVPPPEPAPRPLSAPLPASRSLPPLVVRPLSVPHRTERGIANRSFHWALTPAVASDLGTLPRPAYGFSLAGSVLLGHFRGEAYGAYWPNQTGHGPATIPNTEGGDVELFDGGVRACFPAPDQSARFQRVELSPCAGLEAGALRGRGVNLVPSLTRTGLWLAVTLDARVVVRLSRFWGIALDVGAAVPLRRDVFTFGNSSNAPTLHEAGIVEGRAWTGPELRF